MILRVEGSPRRSETRQSRCNVSMRVSRLPKMYNCAFLCNDDDDEDDDNPAAADVN